MEFHKVTPRAHLPDEETEAQRGATTCLLSHKVAFSTIETRTKWLPEGSPGPSWSPNPSAPPKAFPASPRCEGDDKHFIKPLSLGVAGRQGSDLIATWQGTEWGHHVRGAGRWKERWLLSRP